MPDYSLKNVPKEILEFIRTEQKIIKQKKGVRAYSIDLVVTTY